jgi:hypothetical protein
MAMVSAAKRFSWQRDTIVSVEFGVNDKGTRYASRYENTQRTANTSWYGRSPSVKWLTTVRKKKKG